MRVWLALLGSVAACSIAAGGDSGPPTTNPAPELRSVGAEEARQAYERLAREGRIVPLAPPAPAAPAADSPAIPLRIVGERAAPRIVLPTPAPRSAGAIEEFEWRPDWQVKRLASGPAMDKAELELAYGWEGLAARIRLVPESAAEAPIALILHRPSIERISLTPGMWRVEIDAWRFADGAPTPLARFPGREFARGWQIRLEFEPKWAIEAQKRIELERRLRMAPFAERTPVALQSQLAP